MSYRALVLSALFTTACATAPAETVGFHAPLLGAEPVVAVPDAPGLLLDGVASADAARPQSFDDDHDLFGDLDDREIRVLVGRRDIGEDSAEDLDIDEQFLLGVEAVLLDADDDHGLEFGLAHSSEDGSEGGFDVEARLVDAYAGWRLVFDDEDADGAGLLDDDGDDFDWSDVRPYVAVGAAYVDGDVDVGPDSDDDSDFGAYLRVGLDFDLWHDVRLGLDYRHLFLAELHVAGTDFDADSDQLALTVGFPF